MTLCQPGGTFTAADLDKYLGPWSMTLPSGEGSAGGGLSSHTF